MVDGAHAVLGEELGHQARHRHAVLEHVGDARRRADVVLEHPPRAVGVAHEVAAGDVRVDAARRADAVHDAGEVAARDDQAPRHDAGAHDLARVVDVVDERVERADALRQPALDRDPLVGRDDPRHEVQRERAVLGAVLAGQLEGDALLHEDRVAPAAGGGQVLGPHVLKGGDELRGVRRRGAARSGEDLVEEALAGAVLHRGRDGLGGHRTVILAPSSREGTNRSGQSGAPRGPVQVSAPRDRGDRRHGSPVAFSPRHRTRRAAAHRDSAGRGRHRPTGSPAASARRSSATPRTRGTPSTCSSTPAPGCPTTT